MVKARNNWFCTDPDCLQYCKKVNDTEFKLIQAVWLDTCSDDTRVENAKDNSDNYAVCADFIKLDLFSDEEKEIFLDSYGHTLKSVKENYGDDSNQIIAEYIFEEGCLYDSSSIAGIVSWDDAEKVIQKYIDEN